MEENELRAIAVATDDLVSKVSTIELTSILTSESEISCGWNFLGFNTKATLVKPYPVLIGMEFFFTYHCMAHVQSDGT
ncbi:unnamed protein product [Aspergillus oryzae]|uniref:Unnamed protein product n=1 Tax=Aspergillus oryzae TaxID=5062 RepID=A0AAN4YCJ2_ASPOZ|nr:unnamed protein product [Aspergillus oryzae]GMF94473.1 unnamed protein product [Aspergillus oryzae]GMG25523.1 unnamed protein product [Aspergillus oryzae]